MTKNKYSILNHHSSLVNDKNSHFEAQYPANSRFEEIEKIFDHIKAGDSCQVIGLPGVGRNIVLELLIYNHLVREAHVGNGQKEFHFVGVDFSEVRNKSLFEVTKLMFLELVESLHERKIEDAYEVVGKIFKEALSFQDELVLFQGLKKTVDFLATEKELTIIYLFERFEEYLPMLTAGFFSNLRVLRSKAKYRFSVVFSLGRALEEVVDPFMLADFYEYFAGNSVYLPLANKAITDFRISHLEKITSKTLALSLVEKTLALTGGHGKLTRHCLEIVIQKETMPDIDVLLQHKHVEGSLFEIWYYLTPEEQEKLKEIAKGTNGTKETNEPKGYKEFLDRVGLIKDRGREITIPLLKAFIQENILKQPEQKIVYDEATNSIKRGNDLLSDMLTASEFKLLKLLLNHADSIVTRDQIVSTVWGELASTQGVTEQAIDQLLFRLRKKIEENPNQPKHILTIKGRGIKFEN